jgi:hypothetical protein
MIDRFFPDSAPATGYCTVTAVLELTRREPKVALANGR